MTYGFASHIGIAEETDWATAVAATDYIEAFSEAMATQIDRFETRNITGKFSEPDDAAGINRHEGDLVMFGHPISMGYMLKAAFGINTVTSLAADFFRNDFSVRQSDLSSLAPLPPHTLEVFRAGTLVNTAFQYAGAQMGNLAMNIAPNQDLRLTSNVIAKVRNMIAKTTPSFPGSPIQPFLFDTASLQFGGTGRPDIEALTITLDNQLEAIPALNNTKQIAKVRRNGPPLVQVAGTMDFVDLTDFDRFVNQTEFALAVNLTQSTSFSLLIELPRVIYTAYPVSLPGRERITVEFEGKGRFHTGSNAAITAKLTTTQSF